MKTLVIAGASGFIGEHLSAFFSLNEWRVKTIGRSKADATWNDQPSLVRVLDGADAVVNLSGKSVNCRFNARNVEALINSRVETTRALGEAIALCKMPPKTWVNASGASIYRDTTGKPNTEDSPTDGEGTMADVARKWEQALWLADTPATHKVALRISLVLGEGGGVYPTFRSLAKTFQGGAQGSGKQMMSWIHIQDFCRLVRAILESNNPPSVVNAAAPNPLVNSEFMRALRESLGVGFGLQVPSVLIKIGTAVVGVDSELVLRGMNVASNNATKLGFEFQYPHLSDALGSLAAKA